MGRSIVQQQLVLGFSAENPYRIEWRDEPFSGTGAFTWPDGSRYEGQWLDGLPSGRGAYVWSDGSSYEGEWLRGLPEGAGEYISSDGTRYLNDWKEGRSSRVEKADEQSAELKITIENQHRTISELQQHLARQTHPAQKPDTLAVKKAEARFNALEAEKTSAEERAGTLERQSEALKAELESEREAGRRTLAELQQQLEGQTAAVQKAERAAAEAEDRCRALESEKTAAQEQLKALEEKAKTLASELKTTARDHHKTLSKLQHQLDLQSSAVQKAEAAATAADDRCKSLEAGKLHAEEKVRALEQQEKISAARMDAAHDDHRKAVAELQQRLAIQIEAARKSGAEAAEAAETRYKGLKSEKVAAEEEVTILRRQAEILAVELNSTIENSQKTIAELQQQLASQIEAAQKAADHAAAQADSRCADLEQEKDAAGKEVQCLKRQMEILAVELDSTLESSKKTIVDLQQHLALQNIAAKKADADAAAAQERCRALESGKRSAEQKVNTLEERLKSLETERENALQAHAASVSELQRQLDAHRSLAQKDEAPAEADADDRCRVLEEEKTLLEGNVRSLEQQMFRQSAELKMSLEGHQKTIARLEKQLAVQTEAAQKAEAAAVQNAEGRVKALEAEKIALEEKLTTLEEKSEAGTAKLKTTVKNQKKTITDLKKQLTLQMTATRETSASAADFEDRCNTLEAEKNSLEERLGSSERHESEGTAELKTTIENQSKTITELARQLAEVDARNLSLQRGMASNETDSLLSQGQWSRVYEDGRSYLGEMQEDLPDGLGVMAYPDGGRYVGEWSAGERNGRGTQTSADGSSYAGQWERDVMSGEGILIVPEVRTYMGTWKNNLADGKGIEIHPDGKRYEGEFKRGKYDGQGTLILANGTRYTGEFKNSLSNGKGILKYPNGDRYEGEFRNNQYHGQGTLSLIDGRKYTGELEKGLPHGQGIMILADGRKYIGEFRNGQFVDKKIRGK